MRNCILLFSVFFLSVCRLVAQFPTDPRSDSIDITQQKINLRITDFTNKTISGYAEINLRARMNGINSIQLDLHEFTIDSVKKGTQTLSYTYNDTILNIPFSSPLQNGDSAQLHVWYHGPAQQGSGGWGGFYWSQGIAFNMGVTLYDIPHNAGRFWFPCFDNFTEKALYELYITTQNIHTAICGGSLLSQTDNMDQTKTWHWKLNKPVPSYLVSVAVGPFAFVHNSFSGSQSTVPVLLAATPSDTTAMKNSFLNLENSFHIYEQFYGPYLWERVGYVLVPFNGGAMEHATNIAYQKTLVDGSLDYETVMAHELSHHWWGDLATCETAEDMWINEGMAVFSEYLFLEQVYGRNVAIAAIRSNHSSVIKTAHVSDGGYQPLSGVPQEYTYGKHSYDKGGNVAWSLRGYMGDSLFFQGLKAVLDTYKFKTVNAQQFSETMTNATGYNTTPFFTDWIEQPGFAEFLLDSFAVSPSGNQFSVSVATSQRLRAANHLYENVPLEITFISATRQTYSQTIEHTGSFSQATFMVPFAPIAVFVNRNQKLFYAVTADEKEVKSTGTTVFSYSNFRFTTNAVSDSALVRSEYHWAKPDDNVAHFWKYELTPDRFWKIDGIIPSSFDATATFIYDGSANGPEFPMIYSEDSVVLFYRKNSGAAWEPAASYSINKQSNTNDKKGLITTPLLKGEYCIGTKKATVSINEVEKNKSQFHVFPNPSEGLIHIKQAGKNNDAFLIEVFDYTGKKVHESVTNTDGSIQLHSNLKGKYHIKIWDTTKQKLLGTTSVILI